MRRVLSALFDSNTCGHYEVQGLFHKHDSLIGLNIGRLSGFHHASFQCGFLGSSFNAMAIFLIPR